MNNLKVSGLIIGMRKTGTTWVYENMMNSSLVSLSEKVKESGFFSRNSENLTEEEYHNLFPVGDRIRIEIDTSLIYDKLSPLKIYNYNPKMRIVAIKRGPQEYAVSRFHHAKRTGFIRESTVYDALNNHKWFREELKFNKNIARFYEVFPEKNICILEYNMLRNDPVKFYELCFEHLVGRKPDNEPDISVINPARISSFAIITTLIYKLARLFRAFKLYTFVNHVKNLGLHKKLEKNSPKYILSDVDINYINKILEEDLQSK